MVNYDMDIPIHMCKIMTEFIVVCMLSRCCYARACKAWLELRWLAVRPFVIFPPSSSQSRCPSIDEKEQAEKHTVSDPMYGTLKKKNKKIKNK